MGEYKEGWRHISRPRLRPLSIYITENIIRHASGPVRSLIPLHLYVCSVQICESNPTIYRGLLTKNGLNVNIQLIKLFQFFCPGVHFINTKCRHFKCQNMVLKRQKLCLTFSKFHKTILVFKTPKCDLFITNIGVLNAKKQGV